jgi:hypothetical protein
MIFACWKAGEMNYKIMKKILHGLVQISSRRSNDDMIWYFIYLFFAPDSDFNDLRLVGKLVEISTT